MFSVSRKKTSKILMGVGFIATIGATLAFYVGKRDLHQSNSGSETNRVLSRDLIKPVLADEKDQILRIGIQAHPQSIDPILNIGIHGAPIIEACFEGLVKVGYDSQFYPGIAKSWEVSEDKKVYTFFLRESRWSDGKALTAHDFVDSWVRALQPESGAPYADQLFVIKNAEAFHRGKVSRSELGVKAVDDRTLEVKLMSPVPYFLDLVGFYTFFPTPKHVIDAHGDSWTNPENIVCNGAFFLSRWEMNHVIEVKRNRSYWNDSNVKLNVGQFFPIESLVTQHNSFKAGTLDITAQVPPTSIESYRREMEENPNSPSPLKTEPGLVTYFIRFNTTKAPFSDSRVRRAFNKVVDREAIVKNVLKAGETAASQFTPVKIGQYEFKGTRLNPRPTKQDFEEAKKLLAEAGYPDGKNFPTVNYIYNTHESHRNIALALQQMWKHGLNVHVNLFNQEWKVYLSKLLQLDYSMARAGWVADYDDPKTFLDMFTTDSPNNQTGWSNKAYDEYILKASNTGDQTQRLEYFQQAESLLLSEMPVMPLYVYALNHLVSPKVKMLSHDGAVISWSAGPRDRLDIAKYVIVK